MDEQKLTADQIMDALARCLGAGEFDRERGCEGCPLYEDHYCVDTLYSVIREKVTCDNQPHECGYEKGVSL